MAQPVNPYVAGAPLRGERGFFGRQDTLDWVARELRNPATNALVLFGQRRIGKTTLLLQLQRTLPTDAFLPVYFDLQDQATRSLGAVLADLADTVAERADVETPDPDSFDDWGHFFRHTFLPGLYAAPSEARRPIFLFDEFDVLDQVAEAELPEAAAAKAFFPFLRRTMTEEARPAFVFVVGRRAEDLSLDCNRTFKTSLVRYVWVLDRESAEALVRQAEANGTLRFTDQAVARILSLTSCHPYLTQLLCQRTWERAYVGNPTAPPRIDAPEVEAAVPDALEAGDQALVWLWNGLGPAEKIYTAALAELADERATISEDQVIQVLSAHAARLRTREVELAPRDLVKRRVLEVAGEREYRFAVELFRRWVRQHKPLQEVKDELDRIEPVADRLYEIGRDFFNRRQWEIAIRYFRDGLETYPRHFRARLHLGEALLELGQTDEAIAELERAYELDRDEARYALVRVLLAQAKAREEAGDEDGALAACNQALQISPTERAAQEIRATIWTRRGDAALEQDDLEAALTAYRKAGDAEKVAQVEALQRRRALATLEAKAQAYEQVEEWAEAADVYEQLLAQAPDEESRATWQAVLERCGEEEELARLFAEGVRTLEKKDWQRAMHTFAKVVHRQPDYQKGGVRASKLLDEAVVEASMSTKYPPAQTRPETGPQPIPAPSLPLAMAGLTDRGLKYQSNDDFWIGPPPNLTPEQVVAKGLLYIVADGSDHQGGDVASRVAVQIAQQVYYADPNPDIRISLVAAIQEANRKTYFQGINNADQFGMNTTITAAVVRGNELVVANVGNSRAYLVHSGQTYQLTVDHTWVEERRQAGILTAQEAVNHPQRNVLTRSLGSGLQVQVDMFGPHPLVPGDKVLLCTDGLSGIVNAQEMASVVAQSRNPGTAVRQLVDLAKKRGAPDNVTAVVISTEQEKTRARSLWKMLRRSS